VRRGLIVLVAVLAGCGGSSPRQHAASAPARTQSTTPPDPNADLRLPAHVPRRARGAANPTSVRVIARWLRALRRGEDLRAARFWASGSKFQNATPVLTINTRIEKLAIQRSLPCGARIKTAAGPAPFVVLVFTLTERRGGACGAGAGQTARGAIRVAHGRIVEWYRLPDSPSQAQPDGAAPSASGPSA
jgi:hypothetical protein